MAQTHATQDRVNDFVIKLANVNGTGSASALSQASASTMATPRVANRCQRVACSTRDSVMQAARGAKGRMIGA